jgi:hypothetical protein
MSLKDEALLIGCCGAYCHTCRPLAEGQCRGCKPGYEDGGRDIAKARCKIKVCCFGEKGLATCADCPDLDSCERVQSFYGRNGYKYGRYRQSAEFIRERGYAAFLEIARGWKGPYGKLP